MSDSIKYKAILTDLFYDPLCLNFRIIDKTINTEELEQLKSIIINGKKIIITIEEDA